MSSPVRTAETQTLIVKVNALRFFRKGRKAISRRGRHTLAVFALQGAFMSTKATDSQGFR